MSTGGKGALTASGGKEQQNRMVLQLCSHSQSGEGCMLSSPFILHMKQRCWRIQKGKPILMAHGDG